MDCGRTTSVVFCQNSNLRIGILLPMGMNTDLQDVARLEIGSRYAKSHVVLEALFLRLLATTRISVIKAFWIQ